jgi:phage terminase large subunit-like protein
VIALDLAKQDDIAAKALLFQKIMIKWHYYFFATNYLREVAIEDSRNSSYPGWALDGQFRITGGNVTDFATIEEDVSEDFKSFNVLQAGFEFYQSGYLVNRLTAEGLPLLEYRQTVGNMSAATKELQALILQGRIHHDGKGCLTWQVSNVVGHYDVKDNVYPRRERQESKIDAVVGLIMALGIYINNELEIDWSFKWLPYTS